MKDHVQIGDLIKYALRVNRDQVMDFKYGFETTSPKTV